MIDVNVTGVLATLHAALPSLVANKGHVIQIGSIAARNVFPNSGVYCATKHAVLALSESLRMEFREDLAVTTINPGAVNTAFIDQTNNAELRESYRPQFEAGMDAGFIAEAIAQAIESAGRGVYSEITVRPDRMRIAFLSSSTGWGGLERNLIRYAQWMVECGHEVEVNCVQGSPLAESASATTLNIRHIPGNTGTSHLPRQGG